MPAKTDNRRISDQTQGHQMTELHNFLIQGDSARLFPVLADTNKEQRATSIFLAVMTQVPDLAEAVLGTLGVRVGKRTKMEAYTEVVLKQEASTPCRPDGLLVVHSSRSVWTALIETKIGKAGLDPEQVTKYVELARANGIDAVITISNEFVAKPHHSPVEVSKRLLGKTDLYHWSWASISTQSEILELQKSVDDPQQCFLLKELNRFFSHPTTGIERFTQMAPGWRDIVQAVTNGVRLLKSAPEVEEAVSSWFSEERDLCLQMSRHVGTQVAARMPREHTRSAEQRLRDGISDVVKAPLLKSRLRVPDCAGDIEISADLTRKTISVSMGLRAPQDRKSTKARLNWLLRMLKEDDARLFVRAHWAGKTAPTMKGVAILRDEPESIQTSNPDLVPHTFDVVLLEPLGKRFSGRKTFIEDLERIVPEFYDLVAVNLRAWHAPPPKPVKGQDSASQERADISKAAHGEAVEGEETSASQ